MSAHPGGASCIIAAWNEGPRIGGVLAALASHPLLAEVIVVDDGSSDDTGLVAAGFAGVQVLRLPGNGGKSAAVLAGAALATRPLVLLLDADLLGLDAEAVTRLLTPVLNGRADVAISLRGNAPLVWRLIGLDYISGERVLPREMLLQLQGRGLARFGIEVAMNRIWLAEHTRIAVVGWPQVRSPAKAAKQGLAAGLLADLRMLRDLGRTVPLRRLPGQIRQLRTQAMR